MKKDIHAQNYRPNLIKKIGIHRYELIERISQSQNQRITKDDRFLFIEIIEKYKL
jgi:sRNA-binding carbon storage regulator CsrA